jgi:hypothetical protein
MDEMQRREATIGLFAALALLCFARESQATTLSCRNGVKPTVFAQFTFPIGQEQIPTLSDVLQGWADGIGWNTGGVEGEDPSGTPPFHTWEAILQTPTYGTTIKVETSAAERIGRVTVANNCWAPQEDWRPAWRTVQTHLRELGYDPR